MDIVMSGRSSRAIVSEFSIGIFLGIEQDCPRHGAIKCNVATASAEQRCGGVSCAIAPAEAGCQPTPGFQSMTSAASRDGLPVGRLIKLMFVLWLAGVAMRMTILAMPPVIPQVHDELHMSETQVGLLIGLPLALFAIAAVPGSLLIARIGASLAIVFGMIFAAFAGAARGAA